MAAMAAYVTGLWLVICIGAGVYITINNRNHRAKQGEQPPPEKDSDRPG
jgi:hypothetical protein